MNEAIEIRLRGAGVKPGLIRSHELAEILSAVEDIVIAETVRKNPNAKREDIVVGLYEIADESIGLKFRTTLAAIAVPAFIAASHSVSIGEFDQLSPLSLKPLQVIAGFAKRHDAIAEFKVGSSSTPIAEINPFTLIPKEPKIAGSTEICAKILRVGGKVPKAMLELQDGTVIYCEIPVERAIELAHQLYETALFTGNAVWNAATFDLEEFTITGFRDAPTGDPYEALVQVREYMNPALLNQKSVSDIVSYLRRGEDTE